jgi:DNA-binding NarL/FixJ family response regulator
MTFSIDAEPKHILIVTSQKILKEGICLLLSDPLTQRLIRSVDTLPELLEALTFHVPDVIVLAEPTFDLPIMLIARRIREFSRDLRIVTLQHRIALFSPSRLIKYGVYAILHGNCTVADLRHAVRYAECGKPYLSESAAELLACELSGWGPPHLKFSDREAETFFLIVNGHTLKKIAEIFAVNPSVISMHKAAIKKRINVGSISEMVQYALAHDIIGKVDRVGPQRTSSDIRY